MTTRKATVIRGWDYEAKGVRHASITEYSLEGRPGVLYSINEWDRQGHEIKHDTPLIYLTLAAAKRWYRVYGYGHGGRWRRLPY